MKLFIPLFLTFSLITVAHSSQGLMIEDYLEQVTRQNKGILGSDLLSKGSEDLHDESSLLLTPTLVSDLSYIDERKPNLTPAFQGNRTTKNNFYLGVQKLTTFGLEGKLSYGFVHTRIQGLTPAPALGIPSSQIEYFEGRTELTLSQSLWKNFFGAMTRANQQLAQSQHSATIHTENYKIKQLLSVAEITYWRLALARETVSVARASVDRALRIRDWATRRERLQLGDKSDRLQAEAALELRKLDLQMGDDEVRTASRSFNSQRQIDSDNVPEMLAIPNVEDVLRLSTPKRSAMREDTLAAEAVESAATANAEIALQTLSPDIQLYGTGAFNGKSDQAGAATSGSFTSTNPTWVVGVKLVAPLDIPEILKSRNGHQLEKQAAATTFERKVFEQENDWKDLSQKLNEAKRRLNLTHVLELTQQDKLSNEKDRFAKGRTTTYQVLTFEQDYATAQLSRIRAEQEVVNIIAQMKTFGGQQ